MNESKKITTQFPSDIDKVLATAENTGWKFTYNGWKKDGHVLHTTEQLYKFIKKFYSLN